MTSYYALLASPVLTFIENGSRENKDELLPKKFAKEYFH